ncbi:hypothetical protein JCM6882_002850 [Rhodosporidiobolus microsporus]
MRASLAALALLAAAASAHAGSIIGGLAGTIDNAVEAASLQSAAKVLSEGSYRVKNVATGQTLTYEADGNHITPENGAGTPVNILGYGGGVSWVRLQIGEKDKCMSAQWGGSYNLAGVMYACAVDEGGDVTRADNTLEPTKQWWLLVPVGDHTGDSTHSNGVLLAAQSESVATRQKAHKNGIVAHFNKKNGRRSLHGGDGAERFELVSRAKKTRKSWKDNEGGKGLTMAQRQKALHEKSKAYHAAKKASSSSSSSKKKVAAKKKVVSKAKSTAKKPAATKKKTTAAKKKTASSAKKVASSSSSKKKTTSSSKKPASNVVGVKLNVAVSNKYYIIPVDHLIDMHTLALTGHQIDSFRAQSTALDLWDASDKYQQWTIERI